MSESTQPNAHLPAHLRRVQAMFAGAAAARDGLTDQIDDLAAFTRIIDAWDSEIRPKTRNEVATDSLSDTDPSFDARFDLLVHYGAIIQHRLKAGTTRYTPSPIALISVQLVADLADESASDRLADLIVLALDRLEADDLDAEELLGIADRLTRTLNGVTAEINRAVDLGTATDVLDAAPSPRAQTQVRRVADMVAIARDRFDDVTHRLVEPVDAAHRFAQATDRLVERLTEQVAQTGASGLFALLDPDRVDAAARTAWTGRLAQVARDVAVDAPAGRFTRSGLVAAADEIGDPPPVRPTPPIPPREGAADPLATIERHQQLAARRTEARRRWVIGALADADEVVNVEDVWPAPVQRLVDALALTDDPSVPVAAALSTGLHVDPDAGVAVVAPLRLRRLDRTQPDITPADLPAVRNDDAHR